MNDLSLEQMAEVAAPLDEWCEFCGGKFATGKTADGLAACDDCQEAVIEALLAYERDEREAELTAHKRPECHLPLRQ